MSKKKSILILSTSIFKSGAELSLFSFINSSNKKFSYIIAKAKKKESINDKLPCKVLDLPFLWFYKTINPFKIIQFIYSLIVSTFKLYSIIKKNDIQIVYANTVKAVLYGLMVKQLTKNKLICHVRDNISYSYLGRAIIQKCDIIISNSEFISNQFPSSFRNTQLIYGGIDVGYWKKKEYVKELIDPTITLSTIYIACIGQITRWKNQIDFVYVAKLLSKKYSNLIFLIIGDDLSGREKKYKKELLKLVNDLGLQNIVQFSGHHEVIKDIMNSIDILVHPAINEPFGRVIVEAMALEKPVVAYNCGGPAEIVLSGTTGYLTEPNNYMQLAEKTLELIENKELRIQMGKAGRKRVVEKFNIERYVCEMEEMFASI